MTRFASGGRVRGESGASVLEAVAALVLGLFVVHLGLASLAHARAAQSRMSARVDALVSLRVVRYVLRREARYSDPSRDWTVAEDSVSLRAFRGTALVCPLVVASNELVVAYRGDRAPDPAKDSVVVLSADGTSAVLGLVGVRTLSVGCGALDSAEAAFSWVLDRAVPSGAVLARLFERGSYHLTGSALRYRRGASGRQPLTPELWLDAESGWSTGAQRVGVRVTPRAAVAGKAWAGFLAWGTPP